MLMLEFKTWGGKTVVVNADYIVWIADDEQGRGTIIKTHSGESYGVTSTPADIRALLVSDERLWLCP